MRAEADVRVGVEEVAGVEVVDSVVPGELFADAGQKLHQSVGVGVGDGAGVELGLLADEGGDHVGVESVLRGVGLDGGPIVFGKRMRQ